MFHLLIGQIGLGFLGAVAKATKRARIAHDMKTGKAAEKRPILVPMLLSDAQLKALQEVPVFVQAVNEAAALEASGAHSTTGGAP